MQRVSTVFRCQWQCAGAAAAGANTLKRREYYILLGRYVFEPFGVKTLGPWGPSAHLVFNDITRRFDRCFTWPEGWPIFWPKNQHCHSTWQRAMLPGFCALFD